MTSILYIYCSFTKIVVALFICKLQRCVEAQNKCIVNIYILRCIHTKPNPIQITSVFDYIFKLSEIEIIYLKVTVIVIYIVIT